MAGMEIVDDRYVDYKSLDTPTLIADDFFDAGCVLGAEVGDWRRLDLAAAAGRTRINGVEVGSGRGADVMGHPFAALAWLANNLAQRGQAIRAGQFVFTGSVVETKWVNPGDRVEMEIEGLGSVAATFE
jgi:2-oxo-3-hexenedioate decarboxylase/2-keto-4-pentenoate hydratase